MSLNITINGYILNELAEAIPSAYYQMWFRKVSAGSSSSAWQSTVKQADASGYFNANLGDGDWLTQGGSVAAGDEVVIAAWTGEATRTGTSKDKLAFRVVTITSASVYTQDVTAYADDVPVTAFSIPATVARNTDMTLTNTSSDDHDLGDDHYQQEAYAGETIFEQSAIDYVTVDWGDGDPTENLSGTANGTHQYDDAGASTITVTAQAFDKAGNAGNVETHQVTILFETPTVDFSWDPASPTIQDAVTFTPAITDPDAQVSKVDWYIDGDPAYYGLGKTQTWQYQFSTKGAKTVKATVTWFNGLELLEIEHEETVTVGNIAPTAGFGAAATVNVNAPRKTWASTSTDPDGTIATWSWTLEYDDGLGGGYAEIAAFSGSSDVQDFTYTFANDGDYRLTLAVTDDGGASDSYSEEFTIAGASFVTASIVAIPILTIGQPWRSVTTVRSI